MQHRSSSYLLLLMDRDGHCDTSYRSHQLAQKHVQTQHCMQVRAGSLSSFTGARNLCHTTHKRGDIFRFDYKARDLLLSFFETAPNEPLWDYSWKLAWVVPPHTTSPDSWSLTIPRPQLTPNAHKASVRLGNPKA